MFKNILQSAFKRSKHCLNRFASSCESTGPPAVPIDTLSNGVRVATEQTGSPLACVSLFIEAGPRFETACNNGICHFIEHMAYKGFRSIKKSELEMIVSHTGGRATTETRREMQIFSVQCPSECAVDYVEMLSMVVSELEFNQSEFEETYQKIGEEMVDEDNDPKAVVFDYLHATAFQGTPLGQRVIGPTRNVCRFDKATAMTFLSDHYQPYKFVLATSGDVSHEKILAEADSRFGCLPCDPCFASEDGPCRFTGSEVTYRDDSMPFAHVAIAFEAPGYGSPDYLAMLVMSHMMGSWSLGQGGGESNGSPMARAAASCNMCQSFQSFYIPYRDVGLWGVYFVAKKMNVEDMVLNIQDQWMKFYMTSLPADVLRGQNSARLEVAQRYEGALNSCFDIGTQVMYTGERKPFKELNERLCAVKINSIKEVAEKYLYDRCPAVAAMGPTEVLPEYNRIRSGMYWLRI